MPRSLTIVGASVRAAAASAVRAGYAVRAGDLFADTDLCTLCQASQIADYPRGLATIIRGSQPGGWMYTGALENHPALVGRLARVRPLLGNSVEVLRRVRDPVLVADSLKAAGLQCPDVLRGNASVPGDASWLRKPLRSAGGSKISFCQQHARGRADHAGGYYLQRYVAGLACSAVYVAAGGAAVLWGVTRQLIGAAWAGATGFRYCGSLGPIDLPDDALATFDRIGAVLADGFDLVGLFGVDAIVNREGVWPVEVNPRYTASTELFDWAYGVQAIDAHVVACQSGRLPARLPPRRGRTLGKAIVFAARNLVIPEDVNWSAAAPCCHDWPAIADVPRLGAAVEAGGPIVTVMAEGPDDEHVLVQLRQTVAHVRGLVCE